MAAERLLLEGKVDDAVEELQRQVRADPSDPKRRIFLFQLLAVNGQWSRSLNQLEVAGTLDAGALAMVQTYRETLRCEAFRAEVFSGARSPVVFGEPDEWMALLVEALQLASAGRHAEAAGLRQLALEKAPAISGSLWAESAQAEGTDGPARVSGSDRAAPTPVSDEVETPGIPFSWIADADSRLGPVLEAVVNGRYYWLPFHRVREILVEKPADLRDLVWTPARFTWANGGASVGFIPTRYAGSEGSEDARLRLARRTEWNEAGPETFLGLGQRILVTDADEYPLLEIRRIRLDSPASPEAGGPGVNAPAE